MKTANPMKKLQVKKKKRAFSISGMTHLLWLKVEKAEKSRKVRIL